MTSVSSLHFDYLQHLGARAALERVGAAQLGSGISGERRRQFRIISYGQFPRQPADQSPADEEVELLPFLTTLGSSGVPLLFQLRGDEHGIQLSCGTWARQGVDCQGVLVSALRGQFAAINLAAITAPSAEDDRKLSGLLSLGVPPIRKSSIAESPIDRLIRGMSGKRWTIMIICDPVDDSVPGIIRSLAMAEARGVESSAKAEGNPNPMAQQYVDMLRNISQQSLIGSCIGMWRYCAYLLAEAPALPALAGLWRSLYATSKPGFDPIQALPGASVPDMAKNWVMPDVEGERGPGQFRRLLELCSIVTSAELAQIVQFPKIDTPGLQVQTPTRFDCATVPVAARESPVRIGTVIVANQSLVDAHGEKPFSSGPPFEIKLDSLVKHVFVAGTTGSGKTNTVRALLKGVVNHSRNFMVIEPAKTEYRAFIHSGIADLRVYTMGNAQVAPFFINPFEAGVGTPVSIHLDLLKSLFSASFGMWTPLPQILERCLQAVYADKGWDLVSGRNTRNEGTEVSASAWPTLSELVEKVEETIPTLGYDEKITNDLRASLTTRLNGLCRGPKGRMLNTRSTSSFGETLERNVVFELEAIADDDEKAFVMGLLMIRLFEERRTQQRADRLKHVLVIEEAHRLLSNVAPGGSEENANPRGKAVETFANMLSEMRAYGQGFIVADQVPVKLAPDVIKNSNLKIAHRIVARDDREMLAGSMAMDQAQETALARLTRGQCAIFSEGEDAPLWVNVDKMIESDAAWPDETGIGKYMESFLARPVSRGAWEYVTEDAALVALDDRVVKSSYERFVLAAAEGSGQSYRLFQVALTQAEAYCPAVVEKREFCIVFLSQCAAWWAERRGRQRGLSYVLTEGMRTALTNLQDAALRGDLSHFAVLLSTFRDVAHKAFSRKSGPFLRCDAICPAGLCMYRDATSDLIASNPLVRIEWNAATRDAAPLPAEVSMLKRYAMRLVATRDLASIRPVSLCIAQHLLRVELPDIQERMLIKLQESEARNE